MRTAFAVPPRRTGRAEKVLAVQENVWQTPRARGAVSGDIKTAIFEQVEAHDL
ncbi:MAG TPA: hypothetical protein VFV20_06130 [Candidatus Limnocylindria bacterium]|nr:hypothetical protein [Candidatus Limnocylindria bacterium]